MGLELKNVTKKFKTIEGERVLFEDLTIRFPDYGLIAITGESGCGKSTLLQLIAHIDQEYEGDIYLNQINIKDIKDYRQEMISFVYQNYQLLDYLTVEENCTFYCRLKGLKIVDQRLEKLLELFQLQDLKNKKVMYLSGGQKQRVTLIRALLCSTPIILCDEPTGALDLENRKKVYEILKKESKKSLIIVVSHDSMISKYTKYRIDFDDLKHHYQWNNQLYSRLEIQKNSCGMLFKEMIKMIMKDRKKCLMMFVSQIYMVLAMTLIITGLNGFTRYYQKQYTQEVNNNLVMIQKKNQEPFQEKEIKRLKGNYQYHLDIGKIEGIKNFQSFSINKKSTQNEVYVNQIMINKLKSNEIKYEIADQIYKLKIKGVIKDSYKEPIVYYTDLSLPNNLKIQCIDVSTCLVYLKNKDQIKSYLKYLPQRYKGIALVYEEYQSYFELINLFKKVSIIFILLSFIIATVLIGYIILSMFYENQKIYAMMLANGYQNYHLNQFILKKVLLIMMFIGVISCVFSIVVLKIIARLNVSKKIVGISKLFVLPAIKGNPYILFMIYLLGYLIQGLLLSFFMIMKMKKINMYACLREE